jgi:hypothetical protein
MQLDIGIVLCNVHVNVKTPIVMPSMDPVSTVVHLPELSPQNVKVTYVVLPLGKMNGQSIVSRPLIMSHLRNKMID